MIADREFNIEKVSEGDAMAVWQIRNNQDSRRNSNGQEVIDLDSHMAWFRSKYLSDNNNFCFVLRGRRSYNISGYCRFDFNGSVYITSIALSTEYRGRGLGNLLLAGSLNKIDSADKKIIAEIKKDNLPSMNIFLKNSFKVYKENEDNFFLEFKNKNNE